jgi:hypothetical protein
MANVVEPDRREASPIRSSQEHVAEAHWVNRLSMLTAENETFSCVFGTE